VGLCAGCWGWRGWWDEAGDGLEEGKYPFYTSSENQSKYLNDFQHGPGCLVFGTGGKASVHLTTSYFATSTDCITIKPKPEVEIDAGYVFQYFKGNMQVLENGFKGAGLKHISKAYLSNIRIPYPEGINNQRRIAHLLGKVEALIAQRKQHLQQLDDLLKSVFLEMFGDPVRNEKGWELHSLESIGNVQGGLQVTTKRNDYELNAPYLRVANVYRDRLNLSEIKRIGLTPAELDRVRLQQGDLLIVEGHGNPEEVGRSAVWDGSIESCVHQNHLIRVRVDSSRITPFYASFFVNSPGGRRQMFRAGKTTSGLNTISSKNVKETMVVVPPLELQNQFAIIAEKVEVIKYRYQQSLADLEALYGALSQQAFKGELDLSRVPMPVDYTS
jgi:type I restriction enzyme S subunit